MAIGVINEDEPVIASGYINIPEFGEVKALEKVSESDVREKDDIEKATITIERIPEEMGLESQMEDIPDDSEVPVVDSLTSIESTNFGLSENVSVQDDFDLKADLKVVMPETYAEYSLLSVKEKMELFAITDYADSLEVMRLVKKYFREIGYDYCVDEVMEESDVIYEGARQISIRKNAEGISNEFKETGLSYWYLTVSEKAKLLEFRMDDNHYNLALHKAVLKKLGVDMDFDERYEDYQKVYETGMKKELKDREKDRG